MSESRARLETMLREIGAAAVAVSGGVDSMTLASAAFRTLGAGAMVAVHATSPAVPAEATRRVEALAAAEGWPLRIIEAGEFTDPSYLANPVNRCFFCKTNLYGAIRRVTERTIVSGANLDDLAEYRPGLDAARDHGVRHPYVEAGIDKRGVRELAREFGLPEIADLPSAPCLSSRIETGVKIEPETLAFVHVVEKLVGQRIGEKGAAARAVRCRIRATGIVVELDHSSLDILDNAERTLLAARIAAEAPLRLEGRGIAFAPYRTGSAFLVGRP